MGWARRARSGTHWAGSPGFPVEMSASTESGCIQEWQSVVVAVTKEQQSRAGGSKPDDVKLLKRYLEAEYQ